MSIENLRRQIDTIDGRILDLLQERAELAELVGEEKKRLSRQKAEDSGSSGPINFFDPEREQQIIARLQKLAVERGVGFPVAAISFVFKEIISACRSLEAPFRVAYLGPSGTFTQIAAQKIFGHSVHFMDVSTIEGIFDTMSRGQAEYGVIPLENSYEGGVTSSLDCLLKTNFMIRRQTVMKVVHCLVSQADNIGSIRRLYSHPQAIAQCRRWISENMPGVEILTSTSTAAAARSASCDPSAAAIASGLSAEIMKLNILREGIHDQNQNSTRFVLLADSDGPVTGEDQTSLIVSPHGGPNGLAQLLSSFDRSGVAVLRVESKAGTDNLWEYVYFIDFKGHRLEPKVAALLQEIEPLCTKIKVLGSYPTDEVRQIS